MSEYTFTTVVVWCRKEKIYNSIPCNSYICCVVVWCRKEKIYNLQIYCIPWIQLWFDVEKRRYTTFHLKLLTLWLLWFDVEKRRYTTSVFKRWAYIELWFDVEKRRYTTVFEVHLVIIQLWFDVKKRRYTTEMCGGHIHHMVVVFVEKKYHLIILSIIVSVQQLLHSQCSNYCTVSVLTVALSVFAPLQCGRIASFWFSTKNERPKAVRLSHGRLPAVASGRWLKREFIGSLCRFPKHRHPTVSANG